MTKQDQTIASAAFETMQFLVLDIPEGETPESYMETDVFLSDCAALIKSGQIGLRLERIFDEEGNEL